MPRPCPSALPASGTLPAWKPVAARVDADNDDGANFAKAHSGLTVSGETNRPSAAISFLTMRRRCVHHSRSVSAPSRPRREVDGAVEAKCRSACVMGVVQPFKGEARDCCCAKSSGREKARSQRWRSRWAVEGEEGEGVPCAEPGREAVGNVEDPGEGVKVAGSVRKMELVVEPGTSRAESLRTGAKSSSTRLSCSAKETVSRARDREKDMMRTRFAGKVRHAQHARHANTLQHLETRRLVRTLAKTRPRPLQHLRQVVSLGSREDNDVREDEDLNRRFLRAGLEETS